MPELEVIFASQSDASAVAIGNQIGSSGLYEYTINNNYSISSGLIYSSASSGVHYLSTKPTDPMTINVGYVEVGMYPISGATDKWVMSLQTHMAAGKTAITFTNFPGAGNLTMAGPGATTIYASPPASFPLTGWKMKLIQTEDENNIYATGELWDIDTNTLITSVGPITVSKANASYSADGPSGVAFRTEASNANKCRPTYLKFVSSALDALVAPVLTATSTSSTITLSGTHSGGSGNVSTELYSSDTYSNSSTPGTLIGSYTPGTISGFQKRTGKYFIVKVTDLETEEVVWSNCVFAMTFSADDPDMVIGLIGTSTFESEDLDGRNCFDVAIQLISNAFGGTPGLITGVNKRASGSSSKHWDPEADVFFEHYLYDEAVADFNASGVTHIMLSLGMNDPRPNSEAGYDLPATGDGSTQYYLNRIITSLFEDVPTLREIKMYHLRWPNGYITEEQAIKINDVMTSFVLNNPIGTRVAMGNNSTYIISKTRGTGEYITDESHPSASGILTLGIQLAEPFMSDLYSLGSGSRILLMRVG